MVPLCLGAEWASPVPPRGVDAKGPIRAERRRKTLHEALRGLYTAPTPRRCGAADRSKEGEMSEHAGLDAWVNEKARLCQPDAIHWCDGSEREYNGMIELLLAAGTARKLDESKRPNS